MTPRICICSSLSRVPFPSFLSVVNSNLSKLQLKCYSFHSSKKEFSHSSWFPLLLQSVGFPAPYNSAIEFITWHHCIFTSLAPCAMGSWVPDSRGLYLGCCLCQGGSVAQSRLTSGWTVALLSFIGQRLDSTVPSACWGTQ